MSLNTVRRGLGACDQCSRIVSMRSAMARSSNVGNRSRNATEANHVTAAAVSLWILFVRISSHISGVGLALSCQRGGSRSRSHVQTPSNVGPLSLCVPLPNNGSCSRNSMLLQIWNASLLPFTWGLSADFLLHSLSISQPVTTCGLPFIFRLQVMK